MHFAPSGEIPGVALRLDSGTVRDTELARSDQVTSLLGARHRCETPPKVTAIRPSYFRL